MKNKMNESLQTTYKNMKIGIKDFNGLELFNGDTITIDVAKDVKHEGVIIYDYGAFCLKVPRKEKGLFNITPLRNYALYCKLTKITTKLR